MTHFKRTKAFLLTAALLISVFALSACGAKSKISKNFELSSAELSLSQGDTAQLTLNDLGKKDVGSYTVAWVSDTASVATVDSSGKVTAVGAGACKISAQVTAGKTTVSFGCAVSVVQNTTPLSSISFSANLYFLGEGQTLNLKDEIVFYPANAANKNVSWKTSNAAIAKISDDGVVSPVSEGAVTVTAISEDGSFQASCVVKISAVSVQATGVSFDAKTYSVAAGQTLMLSADVQPADATGYSIVWTSSDPTVATVSGGAVTGVSKGTATVTAKLNGVQGDLSATCTVNVTDGSITVEAKKVILTPSNVNITEGDHSSYSFTATVSPANCTQTPVWSVSNSDLITIDSRTGKFSLTGSLNGAASAAVIVKCTVGSVSNQAVIFVSQPKAELQLDTSEATLYTVGPNAVIQLSAAITNSENLPDVTWTSSDTKVATVDKSGNVTAVGKGSCTVSATCTSPSVMTATCKVTVEEAPYLVVKVGETITLDISSLPDATGWTYDGRYVQFDKATHTVTGVKETTQGPITVWGYSASNNEKEITFDIYVMSK